MGYRGAFITKDGRIRHLVEGNGDVTLQFTDYADAVYKEVDEAQYRTMVERLKSREGSFWWDESGKTFKAQTALPLQVTGSGPSRGLAYPPEYGPVEVTINGEVYQEAGGLSLVNLGPGAYDIEVTDPRFVHSVMSFIVS